MTALGIVAGVVAIAIGIGAAACLLAVLDWLTAGLPR